MNKLLWLALAGIALGCVSCGRSNNLYPVSGTVTYRGNPAAGATVFFHHRGGDPVNEHSIMGIVQEDGCFTLVCGSLGEGAPAGEYDVLIEWKEPGGQGKGLAQKGRDRLRGRYADPARPLLHLVVKPETNQLTPFDLQDEP